MTEDEYQAAKPVIEMAQRLHHSLQHKLWERGVHPVDVLIAGVFSAYDLAAELRGSGAAVEWMRDAIDTIERQVHAGLN